MPRHAEIAGAGFAGLAAAIALRQRGWTVRVHEMDSELRAFGAGIFIWENGLRVLAALGTDITERAFAAPVYETRTDNACLSFQAINGSNRFRLLTMTRQHLHAALVRAADHEGADLVTSSKAIGAAPEGILHLAGGAHLRADLVIGADGVRSAVRDSLAIPRHRKKYQDGIIRVLTSRAELTGGPWDHIIDFWATTPHTRRILYTPCGTDTLYMAMMAPVADTDANTIPVNPAPWITFFPDLAPVLETLGDRGRYDVYETTKLETWSAGRVAILGDSAHAMPPTLAQGAGCAMMNALALAVALEETADVPDALKNWESRERPLTDHTQRRAAEIAASRLLAGGMSWDDEGLRAALHVPTGTVSAAPAG